MSDGMIALPAQLTLRDASLALRALEPAIAQAAEATITLDAAALAQIDSAALAVLLACRRQAESRQRHFEVVNAPARLAELARLYGVQDLLALREST
jgi:phospholipid transport system transporter-binding protein